MATIESIVNLLKKLPNEILFRIFYQLHHSYLPTPLIQDNYFMQHWYKNFYHYHYQRWKIDNDVYWKFLSINGGNKIIKYVNSKYVSTYLFKFIDDVQTHYGKVYFENIYIRLLPEADPNENYYRLYRHGSKQFYIHHYKKFQYICEILYDLNTEEVIQVILAHTAANNLSVTISFHLPFNIAGTHSQVKYRLGGNGEVFFAPGKKIEFHPNVKNEDQYLSSIPDDKIVCYVIPWH